jgi:ketosteroid isomerase-like protein
LREFDAGIAQTRFAGSHARAAERIDAPVETMRAPVETMRAPVETMRAPVETMRAPEKSTRRPEKNVVAPSFCVRRPAARGARMVSAGAGMRKTGTAMESAAPAMRRHLRAPYAQVQTRPNQVRSRPALAIHLGVGSDGDREGVLAANAAFYAAFEMLDGDAMERAWSASGAVSCIHPGGELLDGRGPVMASWRSIFRGTRAIHFELVNVRAFIAGEAAWVVLTEIVESRQGDAVVRGAARATNVFAREDGAWKLVHHHAEPPTSVPERRASPLN